MHRLLLLLAVALLLPGALVACSSDDRGEVQSADTAGESDEGGGDEGAFCDELAGTAEQEEIDLGTPEGMAAFEEFIDSAPDDLAEPMETVRDVFAELEGLDEDDPESFGAAFGVLFDPELLAAFEEIEAWGVENCGLEEGFLDTGPDGGEDSFGDIEMGSGDDDFVQVDEIQEYLDEEYGDRPPYSDLSTWVSTPGSVEATFSSEASDDDAVAVCEAIVEYVFEVGDYEAVEVSVLSTDEEQLAVGDEAGCEPA
ncbi:MAG: hypothetical protein U5R31_17255 [Acidimicrobiia bacterium]|nr:hypothetical protein [Acidimicrobiia bacterium]